MQPPPPVFVSRLEERGRVTSTQAIVRAWLDEGVPEVCLAVADVQTAGRGRLERRWQAGTGQALMVSAGFRPADLSADRAWRLPAVASLAMLEAIDGTLGTARDPADRLVLKWPNDLAVVRDGHLRKIGGVLTEGLLDGDRITGAVIGIGVNVDWPATEFPADLAGTMWSLREMAGGPVDREIVLSRWLECLAPRYEALRGGSFDGAAWAAVQATTGADLEVDLGGERLTGQGLDVDVDAGALRLRAPDGTSRDVTWGEVVSCRVGRIPADV
jgi:BirA family biotin operon repressor/biotin-[acetyl-CoA-carboxylase] ligase